MHKTYVINKWGNEIDGPENNTFKWPMNILKGTLKFHLTLVRMAFIMARM